MHEGEVLKPIVVSLLALGVVLIGVLTAVFKYRTVPSEAPENVSIFTKAARKDLYQDSFNEAVFMRPGIRLTRALVTVDRAVIDGFVNGTAALVGTFGGTLRKVQNGFARSYALTMLAGVTLVLAVALLIRMA